MPHALAWSMSKRTSKPRTDSVDRSEGHAFSPGAEDRTPIIEEDDLEDRDFGWDEGDPADRRRDPLRK
jgi:hypothetical protein